MMSEVDNSTLVESAMEMEALEVQPESVSAEPATSETAPTVSNQEAMVALTLSRVKRQSKQIENLGRLVGQLPAQLRNLQRSQSKQIKQVQQQIRLLQPQLRQLRKQVGRIKTNARGTGRKRNVKRKARKSRSKSRRR